MEYWDKTIVLENLIKDGIITLDRGRVISSIDLMKYPGDYPVYSSSAQKNGYFGSFDLYDFDEELITWSVDGGGYFFYRPKHKFSVTNVSGIMRITKLDKYDYKFLYYLLAYQHKNQIFDYVDKAHPSVIKKRYFIPEIDKTEQTQIATILSKVDEAIAQTEQLIAKYTRIKTGLMQDLLTKGIDENGNIRSEETHEFKDSPLGRIPKEWEVDTLGNIIYAGNGFIQTGPFGSQLHANEYVIEGTPVIMPQDIKDYGLDFSNVAKISKEKANTLRRHIVQENDIIFARRGDLSKCSFICSEHKGSICGTGCLLIRLNKAELNPYWLELIYKHHTSQKEIDISAVGTTMKNLNTTILYDLLIPKISIVEQTRVIDCLNTIQKAIDKYSAQLSKLQSLKTGLMQDLLSGKVRVNHSFKKQQAYDSKQR